MPNDTIATISTPAPANPAPATPAPAPVVEAAPAPAVTPAPAVEASAPAAVEAPKADNLAAPAATVLGSAIDAAPAPEVKQNITPSPDVTKDAAPDGAETTEGGQSENPAPPPKYEPFKFPEGISLDGERVTKFTELLSDLETKGKADHALVQEFGQKAVDFHIDALKQTVAETQKFYQAAWDKQRTDWKDQFMKDPEMGGNRYQTTVSSALEFIRTHGGTAEQQTEFKNLMESSGLGNHPAMIRLLANAGRTMREGGPLAAPKPVPNEPKSKVQTLYGKSK